MEGKSVPDCWAEFKHKFPTVYVVDWMVRASQQPRRASVVHLCRHSTMCVEK